MEALKSVLKKWLAPGAPTCPKHLGFIGGVVNVTIHPDVTTCDTANTTYRDKIMPTINHLGNRN